MSSWPKSAFLMPSGLKLVNPSLDSTLLVGVAYRFQTKFEVFGAFLGLKKKKWMFAPNITARRSIVGDKSHQAQELFNVHRLVGIEIHSPATQLTGARSIDMQKLYKPVSNILYYINIYWLLYWIYLVGVVSTHLKKLLISVVLLPKKKYVLNFPAWVGCASRKIGHTHLCISTDVFNITIDGMDGRFILACFGNNPSESFRNFHPDITSKWTIFLRQKNGSSR